MSTREIVLDLNETGFLCNMMMQAFIQHNPAGAATGDITVPEWLGKLYKKIAIANDEMMAEPRSFDDTPHLILPN